MSSNPPTIGLPLLICAYLTDVIPPNCSPSLNQLVEMRN